MFEDEQEQMKARTMLRKEKENRGKHELDTLETVLQQFMQFLYSSYLYFHGVKSNTSHWNMLCKFNEWSTFNTKKLKKTDVRNLFQILREAMSLK